MYRLGLRSKSRGVSRVLSGARSQVGRRHISSDAGPDLASAKVALTNAAGSISSTWECVPHFPHTPPWIGELALHTSMTLISWSIPLASVGLIAMMFRRMGEARANTGGGGGGMSNVREEVDEEEDDRPWFEKALSGPKPRKKVTEYLQIEKLNDRFDSYTFSMTKALGSPRKANVMHRKKQFGQLATQSLTDELSDEQRKKLRGAVLWARTEARAVRRDEAQIETMLRSSGEDDGAPASGRQHKALVKQLGTLAERRLAVESKMIARAKKEAKLTDEQRKQFIALVKRAGEDREWWESLGDAILRGAGKEEAVIAEEGKIAAETKETAEPTLKAEGVETTEAKTPATGEASTSPVDVAASAGMETATEPTKTAAVETKAAEGTEAPVAAVPTPAAVPKGMNTFVLGFAGDVRASQVRSLRAEITAVLQNAEEGDNVVLILNSGGGTVTGYGLAAAQLARLKTKGLHLTVCVEEVAASGGYMMACVADRLVASPFAMLGSIGVISEMPNVYERLQREGVQFHAVTAGQFKRTMTPFKKFDQKDYEKTAEYLQQIHDLFKHWVSQYRPKLDIQKVATGEVWCGTDALDMKLCDELATTDDVLIEMRNEGRDLYSVAMKRPGPSPLAKLLGAPQGEAAAWETGAASDGGLASTLRGALAQWVMGGAGGGMGGIGDLQNGGLGPQAKSGQPTAYAKSETDDLRF